MSEFRDFGRISVVPKLVDTADKIGVVIRLHPLTFSEYFKSSGLSEYQAWNRYLVYGGMPEAVLKKTDEARRDYLAGLFKTLYFKDIVEHNGLRDDLVLGLLTDVLMSSTGSLTNPSKMANTLSTVREIASYHGDTAPFVTSAVQKRLKGKKSR